MDKEQMLRYIKFNRDSCVCLIRTNKLNGMDEAQQKEQLQDYIDAGAKVLVIKTEYTEDRNDKQVIEKLNQIKDLEYLIFNDITSLGTDIFWILRLFESLNNSGVKLYHAELETTLSDYKLSYSEFITEFIHAKKKLSYERTQVLREKSGKKENAGRPKKKIDHNTLNAVIRQYETGVLSGESAANKLGISESTFRLRLKEYRKKKEL